MKAILILILLNVFLLYSNEYEKPKIEDYQIKGFENINFKNVLLDAESTIDNFFALTDDGRVFKVENMGLMPKITMVFSLDGDISEAFTYDSLHFLSLNTISNSYLIRTKDFINIDTLYEETGFQITDFQIYNSEISMIMNSGTVSKVVYKNLESSVWNSLDVPEFGYNRIATLLNNYYLYKYLNDDTSVLRNKDKSKSWEKIEYKNEELLQFTEMKTRDTLLFACGKFSPHGLILVFDENLNNANGFGLTGGRRKNTQYDFEFDLLKNENDTYQIGESNVDGKGAFLYKFYYQGNDPRNQIEFPYSSSLNKIISNDHSQYKEFVAVGDNGIVLLINRGVTPVEVSESAVDGITIYPNPMVHQSDLTVKCKDIINKISITNLIGNNLIRVDNVTAFNYIFPLSGLSSGTYIIRVETASNNYSKIFNIVR